MNENEEPLVTEAELARVLELDAKATQGPFAVYEHEDHSGICIGPPYRESWMRGKGDPGFRTDDVCRISGGRRDGVTEQQRHDAALIAEYRTLTPRLARELAAARAALKVARELLDRAVRNFKWKTTYSEEETRTLREELKQMEEFLGYEVHPLVSHAAAFALLNTHTHE